MTTTITISKCEVPWAIWGPDGVYYPAGAWVPCEWLGKGAMDGGETGLDPLARLLREQAMRAEIEAETEGRPPAGLSASGGSNFGLCGVVSSWLGVDCDRLRLYALIGLVGLGVVLMSRGRGFSAGRLRGRG